MKRAGKSPRWIFPVISGLAAIALTGSSAFAQVGIWETKASMPAPRTQHAVGVANGILYATGGSDGAPCCDPPASLTAVAYNPITDAWTAIAAMNLSRKNHAAGVIDDIVYAVGGDNDFGFRGPIDAYDPGTNTWTLGASQPSPTSGVAAGVIDGILYVVSGIALHAYNPATDTWTSKAPMPTTRSYPAAGVVNGILYVMGGFNPGPDSTLASVDAYDPATDTWAARAPMPTPRRLLTASVINGILYAIGGSNASGILATVEAYDPEADAWVAATSMPTARHFLSSGVIDGKLYVAGGSGAGGALSTLEVFTPLIVVELGDGFGAPGDTLRVPVSLSNPTLKPVGGIQFDVLRGSSNALFVGLADTSALLGFSASGNSFGDTARVLLTSGAGALIAPDDSIALMTLLYRLTGVAPFGSTIALTLSGVEVGDSLGVAFEDSAVNGSLGVGIRGDINLDGNLSVLDVIKLVRILIGKETTPATGTTAFKIADVNDDSSLLITDVITLINRILHISTKPAPAPSQPVVVRFGAPAALENGEIAVPLVLESDGFIAGLQATFTFDPTLLSVGSPMLAGPAAGLQIDSHVAGGTLRLVVFPMLPGQGIPAGQHSVLLIPVQVKDGAQGAASLMLVDASLSGSQAQIVTALVEAASVTVSARESVLPTSFALYGARPNPFNPTTRIAYDVPQAAHVTLIVYNLLGQEVVRLVDEVKAPGRYSMVWNGRNAKGIGVASGVYLYRLTTNTGFTQTLRMTLLK